MRHRIAALMALPLLLIGAQQALTETRGLSAAPLPVEPALPASVSDISLLTYNVQDLPWPLASDRSAAFVAMAERLKGLRLAGAAPQIVVLQEAFGEEPVGMLRAAGYRHIVTGPDASVPRPAAPEPLDAAFLEARSILAGEGQGPAMGSGLVIASDWPIGGVVASPFPQDACAGWDCLANKGAMIAEIMVPGQERPVQVATSHFNAGRKSGVEPARHLYAWTQQLLAFDRFLAAHRVSGGILLVGGDFNISHSRSRLAAFRAITARWGRAATAMGKPRYEDECLATPADCAGGLPIAANVPLVHSLDWQFANRAIPRERAVIFGPDADGTMLSDHIGYAVRYRITG